MPRVSASQGASKYKSGVQGGATRYSDGISNVDVAPSVKAIAQKDKMIANWLDSVNNGKWEQNLGAISLSAWQTAAKTKGATNYASSADSASQKYAQWANNAYPIIQQIQDEVKAMPSTTMQDSINRMIHNVQRMSALLG